MEIDNNENQSVDNENDLSVPVIPIEHPNEEKELTLAEYKPGKALYKSVLPGILQGLVAGFFVSKGGSRFSI